VERSLTHAISSEKSQPTALSDNFRRRGNFPLRSSRHLVVLERPLISRHSRSRMNRSDIQKHLDQGQNWVNCPVRYLGFLKNASRERLGTNWLPSASRKTTQMAEVAVSERMFGQILSRIARRRVLPVPA